MENVVDQKFWQNKKVFLTGHTGFKGSWLTLWLRKMGASVKGYSLDIPTEPSLFKACNLSSQIEHEFGDINDFGKLSKSISDFQPEIVIHMAAQSLVKLSYNNPIETFQTNVMGTVNLLECCRHVSSVKAILNVTSDKCYENQEREHGYKENEAMGGYDPYSSSKGCSELVTSAFRRSFYSEKSKKGLASARAGNVIGGGDWAKDRLLPDTFRAIFEGKSVVIRNPKAIRPWQHVLEPLSGYLVLAQKLYENPNQYSEGFNFGPQDSDARSVHEVLQKVIEYWGDGAAFEIDKNYSGPHEAHFLRLNIEKAGQVLNWKPTWSLEKALMRTVDWMKVYKSNISNIQQTTLNQIDEYQNESNAK